MDIKYMKRAIELSKQGIGKVNPNPLVGAVIVKNNRIIAEGWHEYFGGNHAEVNAFLNAKESVEGAEMYVTLEPCSHFGKTPPCVDRIIESKLSKVYIGIKDPNPLVAGRGIQKLKDNSIITEVGILEDDIRKENEIFLKYITTKMPFCIMKTAMTLDGKIATNNGDSKWITNSKSREYVHQLRNRVMSIMVGIGTVKKDNPQLTTRLENKEGRNPIRIIIDTFAEIPKSSFIYQNSNHQNTIIVIGNNVKKSVKQELEERMKVISLPEHNGEVDLKVLFSLLATEHGIDSVLLEGGGSLNFSAIKSGVVDRIMSFIAPKLIGGAQALTPLEGSGIDKMQNAIQVKEIEIMRFEEDILITGKLI